MKQQLALTDTIVIPADCLEIEAVRASGAGGQHVNKTSTKVAIRFSLAESNIFPPEIKALLMSRLAKHLDKEGRLRVASQESRSQLSNEIAAREKLRKMLVKAMKIPKIRMKTKPGRAASERRLKKKKIDGQKKSLRQSRPRLTD